MIVIRAPSLFNVVWGVCKYVFPKNALKKMVFSGPRNYLEVLDGFVDRNVLPPCIVPDGRGLVAVDMPSNLDGGIIPDHITGLEDEDDDEDDALGIIDSVGPVGYESTTSLETDTDYSDIAAHQSFRTTVLTCHSSLLRVRGRRIAGGWWNGHNPTKSIRVCSE
jgi:CRAL/TRIO domain